MPSLQRSPRGLWLGPLRPLAKTGLTTVMEFARGRVCDVKDLLAGPQRPLTPPRRLWELVTASSNDFHASGENFRDLLVTQGLQPHHRVLDVGCGIGRLAVPLTAYLSPAGGYEGFDIMPVAIRWCQRITRAFPNFRFQLADVHSDRYHPRGQVEARDYRFPYPGESFDFVALGSVFSHMLPADLSNYLREIARVLRPGGRAVVSCYLLNDDKRRAIAAGRGAFSFAHPGPGYWAEFPDLPEAAVAYEEDWMLALYAASGLKVVDNQPGVWATQPIQGQDMIISQKGPSPAAA
jgi:SAM-dependent methyltransferase